jgi:hypothetical protein
VAVIAQRLQIIPIPELTALLDRHDMVNKVGGSYFVGSPAHPAKRLSIED